MPNKNTSSVETPAELGFSMPAEWEKHDATWLAWPHNPTDWPDKLDTIRWVYGEIVRKIAPGEQLKFSDRLLAPALRPGHYTIQLWIPNPDPSLQFDPLHNFLLSNAGMANPATGLNKLAVLAVVP